MELLKREARKRNKRKYNREHEEMREHEQGSVEEEKRTSKQDEMSEKETATLKAIFNQQLREGALCFCHQWNLIKKTKNRGGTERGEREWGWWVFCQRKREAGWKRCGLSDKNRKYIEVMADMRFERANHHSVHGAKTADTTLSPLISSGVC